MSTNSDGDDENKKDEHAANVIFRHLLIISSGLVSLFFIIGVLIGPDAMDKIGSYFGGVASSIAFIWIAAALFLQMKELGLQRDSIEQSNGIIQRDMSMIIYKEGNFLLGRMLRDFVSIHDLSSDEIITQAFDADRQAGISDNITYILLDDTKIHDKLNQLASDSPSAKAEMNSFIEAYDTINGHLTTLSHRPAIIDILIRNSPMKQIRELMSDAIN